MDTESYSAVYYLLQKGVLAEHCAKGHINTINYVIDSYIADSDDSDIAEFLLKPNSDGMNPLAAALYHQHYEIANKIYTLIDKWFSRLREFEEIQRDPDVVNQMLETYLDDYLDKVDLSTQEKRNKLSKSLVSARSGHQDLKIPRIFNSIESRPYRSFKKERERQLLRQIATQIYYGFKSSTFNSTSSLVEVQLMHLAYKGKHNLFIAANQSSIISDLYTYLTTKTLQDILTTAYTPSKNDEGNLRSKRYAHKLSIRIYGQQVALPDGYEADAENASTVADILLKANIKRLPIELVQDYGPNNMVIGYKLTNNSKCHIRYALKQEHTIYLVEVKSCPHKLRHAEEFLVDIRDFIEDDNGLYSCIGGKKRPCMACSGRMQNRINQYSRFSGGFWINTIEYQSPKVARNTLKLLFTQPVHISLCKNSAAQNSQSIRFIEDHDSGSDSDPQMDTHTI